MGCKSVLETVTLLVNGTDLPADYTGLKGKTVAIVCKPLTSDEFSNAGTARALTEGICERLKTHVKDIHLVNAQKVAKLLDEEGLEDYLEIGKKLKADKVVGIDIESFGVRDGQTLYRGRAKVSIQVYDVAGKEIEWRKCRQSTCIPGSAAPPHRTLRKSNSATASWRSCPTGLPPSSIPTTRSTNAAATRREAVAIDAVLPPSVGRNKLAQFRPFRRTEFIPFQRTKVRSTCRRNCAALVPAYNPGRGRKSGSDTP